MKSGSAGSANLSYKQAMARLDEIVKRVESGDADVDELAGSVKEAAALVRLCRDRLRSTQEEVEAALRELEQADAAAAAPSPVVESPLSGLGGASVVLTIDSDPFGTGEE